MSDTETEDVCCPFCKETGFDLIGLKIHIERGWCEVYNEIEEPEPFTWKSAQRGIKA